MSNENKGSGKMGTMPVPKLFLSMSIPLIISMLVQALYNIVDSIFVSRICEDALSAVSMVFPVQNIMIAVATGTSVGFNALISRRLGQKKPEEASYVANVGIFLGICSYIVFALIGIFLSKPFMMLQTDIPTIVDYGVTYMRIVTVFSFGIIGQVCIERILQSTGQMIFPMITQILGALINILFDWLLIFGVGPFPKMEVAGAALATIFGQIVALVLGCIFNLKYNKEIKLNIKLVFKPKLSIIKEIYAIGIPSIVMISISSVMNFSMNKILIGFTSTAVAVFGVFSKVQSLAFMPIFGMNNALIPIVGYNIGAGNKKRIKEAYKVACISATIVMWIVLAIFQFATGPILSLFDASENMLEIGIPALKILSIPFICAGISVVSGGIFQGSGKSIYSLIVSAIRQLGVLVPLAIIFAKIGGLSLVWWSIPLAEFVGFTVTIIIIVNLFKKLGDIISKA